MIGLAAFGKVHVPWRRSGVKARTGWYSLDKRLLEGNLQCFTSYWHNIDFLTIIYSV